MSVDVLYTDLKGGEEVGRISAGSVHMVAHDSKPALCQFCQRMFLYGYIYTSLYLVEK